MTWLTFRSKRRPQRRVAPERFRKRQQPGPERPRIDHPGERIALLALSGIAIVLILSFPSFTPDALLGHGILIGLVLAIVARYTIVFSPEIIRSIVKQATACALAVAILLVARISAVMESFPAHAVPLSLVTLTLVLVIGQRFALETTLILAPFVAHALGGDPGETIPVTIMLTAGAVIAGLSVTRVRRRSTLLRVGIFISASHVLVWLGTSLYQGGVLWNEAFWSRIILISAHGIVVGFLFSGLLPVIEYIFSTTTDISLLELGNTQEHPLLKKLLVEAPGTFHHSYIVGLLSEAAAESIGANALLARVGAMYHDIGKLNKPGYFAENSPDAKTRHRELTPEMSTLIISAHPRDGIEIGKYYDLPPSILAFMPEHHGTTRIEYFYQVAVKRHGEDGVVETDFRYPGPRPQSLETAIVMIADSVEAISRQMPEPTPARLHQMIHEVSLKRLLDGQFNECSMTFRQLKLVEDAFLQVLVGIFHTRPNYPKGKANPLDLALPREYRFPVENGDRATKEGKVEEGA